MSEVSTITCDGCGADLTYTHNSVDWRLVLANERKPIHPEAHVVTDMGIYRAIEQTAHFCGLSCLQDWLGRQAIHKARDWSYHRWKHFAP